ncbi:MAG: Gfo/Idh/MocA family protein [Chloroflexota bacterium]
MVKLIQVGIGGMGNTWLNAVKASDEVDYAALVEISPATAEAQAQKHGLDCMLIFGSLPEALARVQADGVIVVTPPQTHRDLAVAAMRAGLPVLSEKPLADTREAAADIVRVSQETGMLHMVAQNYRYSRPVQTLKRVLQSGQLGPIGAVTIHFFRGPHFGGFREAMPFPLIMDMSIHHFDMLRFFLDQDPVGVAGRSWNPAWSWFQGDAAASVVITFEAAVATYTGSWCAQGADTPWNGHWRFDCADGVALLEEDRVWTQRRGGERAEAPLVDLPLTAQPYLLHEFVTAITTGRQPATTCFDNIKSLQIVLDAIASFGRHGC